MIFSKKRFIIKCSQVLRTFIIILLEIRLVLNNGGQKHSLSIDVTCPVSGQFFLCCTESMNSFSTDYPNKIYFISIAIIKA